jgi:hypothetical protein
MSRLFFETALSRTPPIMAINKRNGISVGADLSALGGIHNIPYHLLNSIIGPGGRFSCSHFNVNQHNWRKHIWKQVM